MSARGNARHIIHKLTGLYIYRTPPRGTELMSDLQNSLPNLAMEVIFDVGANIGQSTRQYLEAFPASRIYAFEPVPQTAEALGRAFGNDGRVSIHQLALGDRVGNATMELANVSVASRLVDDGDPAGTEAVALTTVDVFCAGAGIDRISYMKIDTEGNDLAVLKGSTTMLAAGLIGAVEVEAGMSPDNDRHARFEDMKVLLETHGYRLFGLYEQVREFPRGMPYLRRTNPVFISPATIAANRRDA